MTSEVVTTGAVTGAALAQAAEALDAVGDLRGDIIAEAMRVIGALWDGIDWGNPATVSRFLTRAPRVMVIAQRQAATAATVTQRRYARAAGLRMGRPAPVPDDIRSLFADDPIVGAPPRIVDTSEYRRDRLARPRAAEARAASADRPRVSVVDLGATERRPRVSVVDRGAAEPPLTVEVFERPVREVERRVDEGTDPAEALVVVRSRVESVVDTNVALAARQAAQNAMVAAGVTHYRRMIHPELSRGGTCGLCIAASTRVYKVAELLPMHDHCHCETLPLAPGFDPGELLNDVDLGQLYDDAGSTGWDLKRTRYKVDEHGELGPVLIPEKRGDRVPRARSGSVRKSSSDPRPPAADTLDVAQLDERIDRYRAQLERIDRLYGDDVPRSIRIARESAEASIRNLTKLRDSK